MTQSSFPTGHYAPSLSSISHSLLVCACRCMSSSVSYNPAERKSSEAKKWWWFYLACFYPLVCVFSISCYFCFFFSLFLSGPVLEQADQLDRFLPWSASHLLHTQDRESSTIRLFIPSLTPTHSLSIYVSNYGIYTKTQAHARISTVLDLNTGTHTDKLFFF